MRIAMVSISFSEAELAASYRAIKLAKYFLRAGHTVDIITATEVSSGLQSMRSSGLNIMRVPYKQPRDIMGKIVNRLFILPDPSRAWVRKVVQHIEPSFKKNPPDVIFVTTPPHSVQMAGIELSRQFNVPYFADLRDDWLGNWRHKWRTPVHRMVAKRCERLMVSAASCITLNTGIVKKRFEERYPRVIHKIHNITNGFDEEDFQPVLQRTIIEPDGRKTLLYAGDNYGGFMLTLLSSVVKKMKEKRLHRHWRIVTAGREMAPSDEYKDVWKHLGMLDPKKFSLVVSQADCLLLVMPPGEQEPSGTVPLKTYQYLRSGSAIVYLGERGSTTELIEQFDGTFSWPRQRWPKLIELLENHPEQMTRKYQRPHISQYSFKMLTEKMLSLFEKYR